MRNIRGTISEEAYRILDERRKDQQCSHGEIITSALLSLDQSERPEIAELLSEIQAQNRLILETLSHIMRENGWGPVPEDPVTSPEGPESSAPVASLDDLYRPQSMWPGEQQQPVTRQPEKRGIVRRLFVKD